MTFLEIKSEKVYSLLAVLLLSGGIAIPVALKRWLPSPTTEPTQPTPLPWWFRHLYFPLATIILYIPVAALWLHSSAPASGLSGIGLMPTKMTRQRPDCA